MAGRWAGDLGREWFGLKSGIVVFAVLALGAMWAAGIVYFRYVIESQIEYTYRSNENLSAAFAAHTEQTLKEIEGMLRVTALEYRRAGRQLDLPRLYKEAGFKSDMLVAVLILDAKGGVVAASEPNYPAQSQAEREYFQAHVSGEGGSRLFSARPVVGRLAKAQILPFSMRLSGPKGEFEGVIVAGVRPDYFINLYRKVDLGSKGVVSLYGLDGYVRARISAGEIGVGQDVRQSAMVAQARANEAGRLWFTAVVDDVTRFYSYQRLKGYPLFIAVGQSDAEALFEVRQIVRTALAVGLLVTLVVLVGTALLWRGLSRDQTLRRSLQDRSSELQATNERLNRSLDELSRARTHLVQSEKLSALGGLVAGVAQEINTPLGIGVTAASHLDQEVKALAERYRSGAMSREDLTSFMATASDSTAMVLSNLQRAAELIRSFKQVAVDQTGGHQRQFYVKEYLQEVLRSLKPQLSNTRHQVSLSCPDELQLYGDPGAVSQIITNLVMNSLIHGFEGKDAGRMAIEVSEQPGGLLLRYSDDGRGIAAEHLPHIFEPFYTTRRGSGGSGLGLHVVYNIVTQGMGGSIQCTSTPGQGVVFDIYMPRAAGTVADAAPVDPA